MLTIWFGVVLTITWFTFPSHTKSCGDSSTIYNRHTLGCNFLYTVVADWSKTTLNALIQVAWEGQGRGRDKLFVRREHFYYVPDTNWADFKKILIKWDVVTKVKVVSSYIGTFSNRIPPILYSRHFLTDNPKEIFALSSLSNITITNGLYNSTQQSKF